MSFISRAPSLTAVISLIFAVSGFTYNAWRLEQSEENNIVRDASFQVLTELAEFEQVLYANHYDNCLATITVAGMTTTILAG